MYNGIAFLISSTYMYSSALCDLKESPGPIFIDGNEILDWSDRVGEPYFWTPNLLAAETIAWSVEIEEELRFNDLGVISHGESFFKMSYISWFV